MATLLDRIRPATRDIQRVANPITDTAATMGDAVDRASDKVSAAVGQVVDRSTELARDATNDLRSALRRTGDGLDMTLRDARARVADGASLDEVVHELERRWPTTSTSRYDRAYERGFARGRSSRLAAGIALGAAAAGAATWFYDPERGAARRAAAMETVSGWIAQGRRMLDERRAAATGVGPAPVIEPVEPRAEIGMPVGPGRDEEPTATFDELPVPVEEEQPVAAGVAAIEPQRERGTWSRDLDD